MTSASDQNATTVSLQDELSRISESYDQVLYAATKALERLQEEKGPGAQRAHDITVTVYDTLRLTPGRISRASFPAYLSTAVRLPGSRIASKGRGRAGGYVLIESAASDDLEGSLEPPTSANDRSYSGRDERERRLYPIFHRWLVGQDYQSRITASMRALGKWSNPDVTGIRVKEHWSRFELEITTIEVKKDLSDWERMFFEAVSHRRYANKAYFAFPVKDSEQRKIPDEMRYYAELYQVGILTLVLSDEDYDRYRNEGWDFSNEESAGAGAIDFIDDYVKDIIELYSPRATQVPVDYQRKFCEALQIADMSALFTWGVQIDR